MKSTLVDYDVIEKLPNITPVEHVRDSASVRFRRSTKSATSSCARKKSPSIEFDTISISSSDHTDKKNYLTVECPLRMSVLQKLKKITQLILLFKKHSEIYINNFVVITCFSTTVCTNKF